MHRLMCGGANCVEVRIVVEHGDAVPLGNGGEQQIRKASRAVLATPGQELHHLDGAIEVNLFYRETRQAAQLLADGDKIAMALRAEQHLELQDAAGCNLT